MEREDIALRAKTADDALHGGRDHRLVAEFLAGMHVGKVQLDHRDLDGADGIMKRDGRVGIGTGVDGDAGSGVAGFVNPVDQIAFVVRLAEIDGKTQLLAFSLAQHFDIGERLAAIDTGLALAEGVKIGAVEHEKG